MDQGEIKRLTEALESFTNATQKLQGMTGGYNNGIHLNVGGVAVWCLASLVAVLLVVCTFQFITISDFARKLDRNEDYVNSIYRTLGKEQSKVK